MCRKDFGHKEEAEGKMGTTSEVSEDRSQNLLDDPARRNYIRQRLKRYLDLSLALASILLILIAVMELGGELGEP